MADVQRLKSSAIALSVCDGEKLPKIVICFYGLSAMFQGSRVKICKGELSSIIFRFRGVRVSR